MNQHAPRKTDPPHAVSKASGISDWRIFLPVVALVILLWVAILVAGCDRGKGLRGGPAADSQGDGKLDIVTTTGMIRDMVQAIVGDDARVHAMMGAGTDPHLYQPNRGDIVRVLNADIVVYNGLHLEGRLGEVLERRKSSGDTLIAVGELLPPGQLLDADAGLHDPHIWMDVSLWRQATELLATELESSLVGDQQAMAARVKAYRDELTQLDRWGEAAIASIPENQRVLVTAHDAFRYFGKRYGIAVHGVQGVSTVSESAISDVNRLVELIVDKKIPAIFFETSVPQRQIEAIVEGARQKGVNVSSDWTLFSDSMGADNTPEGTYVGMMKHNFRTITEALGGDPDVALPASEAAAKIEKSAARGPGSPSGQNFTNGHSFIDGHGIPIETGATLTWQVEASG
tara:strand:+ start:107059 stop:108261 length:1203 start_codon:yes stop_codon:yes gene_type:complete